MSATKNVSFLPDDFLARKQRRRTNIICASLFLVVVGSVVTALWINKRTLAGLEKQYAEVDQQYQEGAKRIEQVKQMQERQRIMDAQTELSASLLERVPRSRLLAEITNARPQGVSLLELDMVSTQRAAPAPPTTPGNAAFDAAKAAAEAKKAPVNVPKQYDVALKVQGVASNDVQVAAFISKLALSKMLKDVNLQISEEYVLNYQKMRKFTLEMKLHPNARVTVDGAVAGVEGGDK